ncbi:MAG: hypothetical protein ACTSYR_05695, partial [Candidatus Odinarchaeia archaeon]
FIVPFVFLTPLFPLIFISLLALFCYIPHRIGKFMFWFQTEENIYEISFAVMWGFVISMGWLLSGGNFWFGALPALFMALGDAVTGFVRNAIFKKRTKSWFGNLAMALVCMSLGVPRTDGCSYRFSSIDFRAF